MRKWSPLTIVATCIWAGLCTTAPAQAQLLDMLKNLAPPGAGIPTPPKGTASATMVADAPPASAKPGVEAELRPDANCSRQRESFNIGEKLMQYGGAAAGLRLRRLIETDFAYDDLTPKDKAMLKYLAQTTVWLPVEAETKLGAIVDGGKSWFERGPKLTELDEEALRTLTERLTLLKGQAQDFPADIKLVVDDKLDTGAVARFGGAIQVSRSFLNGLTQQPAGADFVLAHEMSHIYKRHAIKDIQFKLISSRDGWTLASKLLQRAQRGLEIDPIADGVFLFTTVPTLIEYVKTLQLKYGREQELEADACSVAWLNGIGTDPFGAWDAYRATVAATDSGPTSYAATHPSTPEREARFKRKASGKPSTPPGHAPATAQARKKP